MPVITREQQKAMQDILNATKGGYDDQSYGGKRRRSTRRGGRKSHRGGKRRSCKKH